MSEQACVLLTRSLFTGLGDRPAAGAVVVKGRRIAWVGPREAAVSLPGARIIDCGDRTVMPAFHDAHLHLIIGALSEKGGFLRDADSEDAAVERMFCTNRGGADDEWLLGGAWDHFKWPGFRLPSKESLDRRFPNRRVFLLNKECHGAWVNSRTLAHFGIDARTPEPVFGEIRRDADGNPTGYLHEGAAMEVLRRILSEIPRESFGDYVAAFTRSAYAYGVTAVSDMQISGISPFDVYAALEEKGALGIRVHYAAPLAMPVARLTELRARHTGERLRFSGVKDFVDGTPMGHTGLMIEPYTDRPGFRGEAALDPVWLSEKVTALGALGIRTRLHCCGDGAVRMALDCFEAAANVNGRAGLRHCIEHIEVCDPLDIPRFGALGVIASVQPEHLPKYDFENHPFWGMIGEARTRRTWPFKSLLNAGGRLAFGTDYCVSDLNPMRGVCRAVTRLTDDGKPQGGFCPSERLSLSEALRAYTLGSAFANEREGDLGTLEAGKLADIVILDRDIFAGPPEELSGASVSMTFFDGERVYEA